MSFERREELLRKARLWLNACNKSGIGKRGMGKKRRKKAIERFRKKKCQAMEKTDLINDMNTMRSNAIE